MNATGRDAATKQSASPTTQTTIPLLPGERWWGGAVADARHMPYGKDETFTKDLAAWHEEPRQLPEASNQVAPLLLSTRGRYIWSDTAFTFTFTTSELVINHAGNLDRSDTQGTLQDAYHAACAAHFPPSGKTVAIDMLNKPQYNTWIEMPYEPTQKAVEQYAKQFVDSGMPAGIIMIDDKWSPDYGNWTFDTSHFPDPQGMIDRLHEQGFSVMVWLVPFISPDSPEFRELEAHGLLIRDHTGKIAIRRWWNGLSAVLDLSHPDAIDWICGKLDDLRALGVDGFKFDGADFYDFHPDDISYAPLAPEDFCERWARIGLRYPFNEFRACWKMAGQPLAQRLQDKPPLWNEQGIGSLIPEMLAQSMMGHAFVCPDMIGGGEIESMRDAKAHGYDQEFFVRYAQIAALSPMMQFSVAPARVLDEQHLAIVMDTLRIRDEELPHIIELAQQAATHGDPIIRPMAYHYADMDDVTDQFMVGDELIVAPVLEQGATSRIVAIPEGTWISDTDEHIEGPVRLTVEAPLARLPRFRRVQ